MAATVVSIINLKGGVGKSTLTMMLGEYLAFRYSKNVLLIDMDAQANLSYCMVPDHTIQDQERLGRTVFSLFQLAIEGGRHAIDDLITHPPLAVSNIARSSMVRDARLHMIVSTPSVAQLDELLLERWERGDRMPTALREALHDVLAPVADQYDYILIDCPPGLSLFSSSALIASDFFVCPVIPEPLSLQGVNLILNRARELKEANGDMRLDFGGVILNIVKHYRTTHDRVSNQLYHEESDRYRPFLFWLPDNERLRKLGEFDPDTNGDWAAGTEQKFPTLHNKYSLSYKLKNPSSGSLNRAESEGDSYQLEERIANLVEEFVHRCGGRDVA